MQRDQIVKALIDYVSQELLDGDARGLDADTPLLELGILDSMAMVSLLGFIDNELDVTVPDDKVRPEHFATMGRLADLVARSAEAKSAA